MHRNSIALGVTASVALLLATGQPVLARQAAAPAVPEKYAEQQIRWKPCFDPGKPLPPGLPPGSERLECGEMRAPQDWANPRRSPEITIAVSKLPPKSGPSDRALFTNPGGPGGAGMEMPLALLMQGRTKLLDSFDVYGIDVRGTGLSSTVSCGSAQPSSRDMYDRSPENIDAILRETAEFTRQCQRHSGGLGPKITTEQTVADLDLLRQVERREKISWYGVSAGTWLGAYYATYFPKAVDKFVLDSNTQFTGSWQEVLGWQPMSFQRRLDTDLLPWLAKYDDQYGLGGSPGEVQATIDDLRATLKANPLPIPGGPPADHNAVDALLVQSLYSKYSFPEVAKTLVALRDQAGGTASEQAVAAVRQARSWPLPMQVPAADSFMATLFSIRCNDTPFKGNEQSVIANSELQGRLFPFFGYYTLAQACATWQRPDVRLPEPTGEGLPPVLMLQSERDPATAAEGALIAHHEFEGSRLVTVRDEGDHGVYGAGNACVDDVVESFLIDGVVPERDLTCEGTPLPVPDGANAEAGGPASLLDSLRDLVDAIG